MCIVCGTSGLGLTDRAGEPAPPSVNGFALASHPGLYPAMGFQSGSPGGLGAPRPITFEIINTGGATDAEMAALINVITGAWTAWAAVLGTEASPVVRLSVLTQTTSGRAQGGAAQSLTIFTTADGRIVGEPTFNQELRTGVNPNGTNADWSLQCDIDYLRDELFFDTTLNTANDIPTNRTDAYSVYLHEIGHALGFNGFGPTAGHNFQSIYDFRSDYSGAVGYYVGPNTLAAYGGPLPLTTGNIAHYGNRPGAGSELVPGGLMNGVAFTRGVRYTVGNLDMAVLEDHGLPSLRDAVYDQTWLTLINGGGGIDTFQADYSGRTAGITLVLNTTSFTAPSTLPANQAQTITVQNIERLNLTLGSGNDVVTGGIQGDVVRGGAGNDLFRGLGGNDSFDGGAGVDLAFYSGVRRQYVGNSTGIAGNGEGFDTFVAVEGAVFTDGVLSFDRDGQAAQVMRLYDAALNRVPDGSGFEAVLDLLEGGQTIQQVAALFLNSPEFQARFGALNNLQFIQQMYRFALRREGDAAGIQAWTDRLNSGTSRTEMLVIFSESEEHRNITQATLNQGLWVADHDALRIARMYDATFDRPADSGGLAVWTANLKAGMSMLEIATAFAGSAEFVARYGAVTNEQFIRQMYQFCLNRQPDADGLAFWVNALNSGTSRAQMLLNFSESAEHVALMREGWIGGIRTTDTPASPLQDPIKGLDDAFVLPPVDDLDQPLVLPPEIDDVLYAKAEVAQVLPNEPEITLPDPFLTDLLGDFTTSPVEPTWTPDRWAA